MDLQVSGQGRREQRVPLDALVELRSEDSDEVLEADGIDLGPGGLSLRASFVPPVGARLDCHFRCPPSYDPVNAQGEVVWSEWSGPRSGAFGLRFLELDTKSATAIRRMVEPGGETRAPDAAAQPKTAVMRIDGLGAPVEADVRVLETDHIVLEQELLFLKLGRGVDVDVPGQGKKRGRIASVELRHGPLDVPTLVFGVLLDEAPSPAAVAPSILHAVAVSEAAEQRAKSLAKDPDEPAVAATYVTEPAARAEQPNALAVTAEPQAAAPTDTRPERSRFEAVQRERAPEPEREPAPTAELSRAASLPALREIFGRVSSASSGAKPKLDDVGRSALDRARSLVTLQRERLAQARQARLSKQRRTTSPAPKPRAAQPVARRQAGGAQAAPAPRNRRLLAAALSLAGVGFGVYALAPRSEADRIPLRPRAAPTIQPVQPSVAPSASVLTHPQPEPTPAAPSASAQALDPTQGGVTQQGTAPPAAEPANPASSAPRVFGAAEVHNGRTFALRMSGPVETVEGEARDDGFTVRVPGRLALDRASPIATSHRAVARAMILNRGNYAELTVDFLPGFNPKYQVVAKDNTIEVTLERP
jgi:hypothetical protein